MAVADPPRRGRWLPWAASGLVVALFAAVAVVGALVDHKPLSTGWFGIGFVLATLAVGFVLARHQPRNPIGWLMLSIPTFVGLFVLGQAVALATYRHHPVVAVSSTIGTQIFYYCFVLSAPLVLLFFPDGTLPSPRWRPVVRAYLVLAGGVILVNLAMGARIVHRGSWHFNATGTPTGAAATGVAAAVLAVLLVGCLALAETVQ